MPGTSNRDSLDRKGPNRPREPKPSAGVLPTAAPALRPDAPLGGEGVLLAAVSATLAPLAEKLGLNCNAPTNPDGSISARLSNPMLIKDTGVTWVRLNFILRPFASPEDPGWQQTYRKIVGDLRTAGLQIYGLIHSEAVADNPGNQFRFEPPSGVIDHEWIGRYAANFRRIVQLFGDDVAIFESFNEPNNWHRTPDDPTPWTQAWIHPGWFAIILQRVYDAVHDLGLPLVSGPLLSTEHGNDAAAYLPAVYRAGRERFGWGQDRPFPFDGVGYHPYLFGDPGNPQVDIPGRYTEYMDAFRAVVRDNEGVDKPIYLSELGYQNAEDRQAECMEIGLLAALRDSSVALCIWYGMQDDGSEFYGLFRAGGLGEADRKPVYERFKRLAALPERVPVTSSLAVPMPKPVPNARFCRELDGVPDYSLLLPGTRFTKVWQMENTGGTTWDDTYRLVAVSEVTLGAPPAIPVPSCAQGGVVNLEVPMTAPLEPGNYTSTWQLADGAGNRFGDPVWTILAVATPAGAPVTAPFPALVPPALPLPGHPWPSQATSATPADLAVQATAVAIIYQTYWLRASLAATQPDAQQAIQAAADDALRRLRELANSRK